MKFTSIFLEHMIITKNFFSCLLISLVGIGLSGCFQVIEEVNLHADGSGEYLLTINLSQSKIRIGNMSRLDSLAGINIPNRHEINEKLNSLEKALRGHNGINNVSTRRDFEEYIFSVSFEFLDVRALDEGLYKSLESVLGDEDLEKIGRRNFSYDGKLFKREFQVETGDKLKGLVRYKEDFSGADFTAVYRFPQQVKSVSNKDTRISKNGKSTLLKYSFKQLGWENKTIKNTITF